MPNCIIFFLLFLLLCLMVNSSLLGAYYIVKTAWIYPINTLKNIYKKEKNFINLYFLIKKPIFFYLLPFLIFNLLNLLGLGMFIWIWTLLSDNIYYILGFIIVEVLTIIINYLLVKKIRNKIYALKLYSKTEIVKKFKKYYINYQNNLELVNFIIYENNKVSPQNKGFHFNQLRYGRKIKKLKTKNLQEEEYYFALFIMFKKYLSAHLLFLKSVAFEDLSFSNINKSSYVLINDEKSESLNFLKEILINNFFAYANN